MPFESSCSTCQKTHFAATGGEMADLLSEHQKEFVRGGGECGEDDSCNIHLIWETDMNGCRTNSAPTRVRVNYGLVQNDVTGRKWPITIPGKERG